MTALPTDRRILECIHEMYQHTYPGTESGEARGKNDPYDVTPNLSSTPI
jgi:hypothetical protein